MQLDTKIVSLNLRPVKTFKAAPADSLLEVGACSHPGRVRENNEDSFLIAREMNLFLLSDGMGGLACGEIASRMTVDTILECCRQSAGDAAPSSIGMRAGGVGHTSQHLAHAVRLANQIVHRTARENAMPQAMGATIVAVHCVDERLTIAHVGDSRAYRLRNGELQQLTQDHSFIAEQLRIGQIHEAEAGSSNLRHMLTRAVGIEPEVEVEITEELLLEGDTLLLCSDGLTRDLSDRQIALVLGDSEDVQQSADQLVNLANEAGGGDNITAIVLRRIAKSSRVFSKISRMGRWFGGLRS